MILTENILNSGMSERGGWSKKQLRVLGVEDFIKGWKKEIIGLNISEDKIRLFKSLKNKHLKDFGPNLFGNCR